MVFHILFAACALVLVIELVILLVAITFLLAIKSFDVALSARAKLSIRRFPGYLFKHGSKVVGVDRWWCRPCLLDDEVGPDTSKDEADSYDCQK